MSARALETLRIAAPVPYADMLARQIARRNAVEAGEAPDALFLLQHTPVVTLGRAAHRENVLGSDEFLRAQGVELCEADRGGDVTYHGPGQLVAYPIICLQDWQPSVGAYLRALEQVIIDVLANYGLHGERLAGFTGVWVNGAKIAAIGIGVHRWVSYHGIAINLAPDMDHFRLIVPCGIGDKPLTSLAALLEHPPAMPELMDCFEQQFRAHFGYPSPSVR